MRNSEPLAHLPEQQALLQNTVVVETPLRLQATHVVLNVAEPD
jgi:hypothetical protein